MYRLSRLRALQYLPGEVNEKFPEKRTEISIFFHGESLK